MKVGLFLLLMALFLMSSCVTQDPKEVHLHTDECSYCKMVVSDMQFASQMVSKKGKPYVFDSIECMAAYSHQHPDVAVNAKHYVPDYTRQNQWLPVENAHIYYSENIQSPMGLSLFALPDQESMPSAITDANEMNWEQAKNYVVEKWDITQ